MSEKRPLIIVAGATGVGKTDTSIILAKKINGEIISADSMQVYKGFDIGTAKINRDEMEGIRHYNIDVCEPEDEFNIYSFKKNADEAIEIIYSHGKIPIIVGGTGFYIQAVAYGTDFEEEAKDKSYRSYLEELHKENGSNYLHEMLKRIDPESAELIHENNVKRVIRALEFFHENNIPISVHNKEQKEKESPFNLAYFIFDRSRETIYNRINLRVEKMFNDGLEEEVRMLLKHGVSVDSQAMQGLGYKEMVPYINGEYSLEEAKEKIKLGTRHFAKRQNTWFKREKDGIWFNIDDYGTPDEAVEKMIKILKEKRIV